ncbi:hypothetical protein [Escherichia coli]|uniref:hypothetical protein n=1 Tax=Escherichia coli TaxID=562 RepID=UPI00398350FD
MSENNQNNRNFTSVIKNKRAFFSGLDWKTLPSEEKNARTFARKNDAEYFLSCQYQDSENETKTMVAFIRKEDLPHRGVLILVTGTDDKTPHRT